MPAGTGVWVVNTVPARAASMASSQLSPSRGDELADALQAQESGVSLVGVEHLGLDAERPPGPARPPMPSRISWRTRCSDPPP